MSKRSTVDSGYGTSENGDHNWPDHNEVSKSYFTIEFF